MKKVSESAFFVLRFTDFFGYFLSIFFSACDTCDSKKTTSLLEGAHTYAYAREEKTKSFAMLTYHFLRIYKIICQFFVVFSLFGTISPHIHIGSKQMKGIAKNSLLLSNSTEGKCLKRDSNSYSRNGQGILSPSCLPFHHSGVRWCKGKYFEKSGQMFWLVLHHKCIRIS